MPTIEPTELLNELAASGVYIPGGAVMAGVRADCVAIIDPVEHDRRRAIGMGAVTGLAYLDLFMALPVDAAIPLDRLTEVELGRVRRAPSGCLRVDGGHVTRIVCRPSRVELVVVPATGWRHAVKQASAFRNLASTIMVFPSTARLPDTKVWEASMLGLGVWRRTWRGYDELVPHEPFTPRCFQPAGWRFEENAYHGWLDSETTMRSAIGYDGSMPG